MSAGDPPKRPIQKVAQGSYGCVYRPAFRCAGEPNTDEAFAATRNGKVSKLLSRNEARQELEHAAVVRAVDPNQKYIVYAEKSCDIHPENVEKYKAEFNACTAGRAPKPNSPNAVHLYMPDAGVKLEEITPDTFEESEAMKVLPLFESFLNLFDGLIELHKNDFVHMDITDRNIVARENSDGTWTSRFIDLGFSIHLPEYFKKVFSASDRIELITKDYYAWPAYVKFVGGQFYQNKLSIEELLNLLDRYINDSDSSYKAKALTHVFNKAPAGWTFPTPFDSTPYRTFWERPDISGWVAEFRTLSTEEKIATKLTPDIPIYPFVKQILCGADVYALGMFLHEKFSQLIWVSTTDEDPSKMYPSGTIYAPTWYATNIWNNISKPLEELTRRMMGPHVAGAISLSDARNDYAAILATMRPILTQSGLGGPLFPNLFIHIKESYDLGKSSNSQTGGARIKLTRRRRKAPKPRKTRKTRGTRRR